MKEHDIVKVIDSSSSFYNQIGTIISVYANNYYLVEFDDGELDTFNWSELTEAKIF